MTKQEKNAKRREYYKTHKEQVLATQKKWRESHREAFNEYHRNYQKAHREEIKAKKIAREKRLAYCRAYSKEWYLANQMYKKTYRRVYGRLATAIGADAINTEVVERLNGTLDTIITDRRSQVEKGRWIDQRTGKVYTGIR